MTAAVDDFLTASSETVWEATLQHVAQPRFFERVEATTRALDEARRDGIDTLIFP